MKRLTVNTRWWLYIALLPILGSVPLQLRSVLRIVPSHYSDFRSPWMGVIGLLHGTDAYGSAFTHEIQLQMFGKIVTDPHTDSQAFVYPAQTAILLSPFALLPWKAARILLTVFLPVLVAVSTWLWAQLCSVERGRWLAVCLVTLSWPSIWAYQQTQLTVVVLAALAGACFLLSRESDGLAGILLAISTIKPNVALLLTLWLLLQMTIQRRWRFLLGFGVAMAALLGTSQILFGGWASRWAAAARLYSSSPFKPPLLILIFGHSFGMIAVGLLASGIVVRLVKIGFVSPRSRGFSHAVALILAFTTCAIPTTMWMIYNELALVPAVLIVFAEREKRNPARVLARWSVCELIAVVPICAAVSFVAGYKSYLAILPFLNLLTPALVAIALVTGGLSKSVDPPATTSARWKKAVEMATP